MWRLLLVPLLLSLSLPPCTGAAADNATGYGGPAPGAVFGDGAGQPLLGLASRNLVNGTGDGLLTYDPLEGLEWLDLSQTRFVGSGSSPLSLSLYVSLPLSVLRRPHLVPHAFSVLVHPCFFD